MTETPTRRLRVLLAEVLDVFHDLPVFLTAPLYRKWHRHWGATPTEITESLPGDALLPHAQFRSTRAITIDASPDAVWPWLVQVGAGRAGFYSNDLLDNLGRPSATTIVADLQHVEIGQWIPMSPTYAVGPHCVHGPILRCRGVAAVGEARRHVGLAADSGRGPRHASRHPYPRRL